MSGEPVTSIANNFGIGKLISVSQEQATIEYFVSIGERFVDSVPTSSLRCLTRLHRQTRCYRLDPETDTWQIGRIGEWDDADNTYEINLPGRRAIWVPVKEIYVRCHRPIEDPTDILILKGHETPFFHDRRRSFVQYLIDQRSAARGMTALLSSCIALYPHQAEAVRRVLEDPIQRYLLADEVGLGKTIEAGILLRQYLLDEDKGQALVVVPPHLLGQWHQELDHKFFVSDFEERVRLITYDEVYSLRPERNLGMLIVDEAHHIAGDAFSLETHRRSRYLRCEEFAQQARRLLLLSATPILNNESDFLAMLHLLDPKTYRLDQLDDFKERVKRRQDVGHILLSLQEEADPFTLEIAIERLREAFPDDAMLSTLLVQLERSLEQADERKVAAAVRSVRVHVSDTYRLHRRMVRSRRDSVSDVLKEMRLDGTTKTIDLVDEPDLDDRSVAISHILEDWRLNALSTVEQDGKSAEREAAMARIFLIMLRASGTWLGLLESVIKARLSGVSSERLRNAFEEADLTLLIDFAKFAGEDEILFAIMGQLLESPDGDDRLELLEQVVSKLVSRAKRQFSHRTVQLHLPKIVVFTSFTSTAKQILDRLRVSFGTEAIVSHVISDNREKLEENVSNFREMNSCFVLICDSSGEEGRNLQFADWIFHFDLPWSPNKLEQRIGRVDRIGRSTSVRSRVFSGPEEGVTFQGSWFKLLKDGFGVFSESIAGIQIYVDRKLPELERVLFKLGAIGIAEEVDNVRAEIAEERVRINEQNTLDEIDALEKRAAHSFQDLCEYDSQGTIMERVVEGWAVEALKFGRSRDYDKHGVMSYRFDRKQTLVPADLFLEYFASPLAHQKGTYKRTVALDHPGVRLFRIGEGFIDVLNKYVSWDDRGRAFAMWRQETNWNATKYGNWIGFRFDYIVELNLRETLREFVVRCPEYGVEAIWRRGDLFFPPLYETIFIDTLMSEVLDPELLKILARPYSKSQTQRDYNLNDDLLEVIDRYFTAQQWEDLCRNARIHSESILQTRLEFITECERRANFAERDLSSRIEQFRLRLERDYRDSSPGREALQNELQNERELKNVMIKGMLQPLIRLDSVGLIIVSNEQLDR